MIFRRRLEIEVSELKPVSLSSVFYKFVSAMVVQDQD